MKVKGELWKVTIIESERGWGQSVIGSETYTKESEAIKRCDEINKHNTSKEVPDYYTRATYERV